MFGDILILMEPDKGVREARPTEAETLVQIKQEKIRRLDQYRRHLSDWVFPRWVGKAEAIWLAVILLANLLLLLPFYGEPDKSNVFSAPLVPLFTSISGLVMEPDYGVRFWLLNFLAVFPVPFYLFVREVTKKRLVAALASLIASLPTGLFLSLRVEAALYEGDGARVASMTLVFLVCWLLVRFLREGQFGYGLGTGLGVTLVALTSPLGLLIMFCFALTITFSEMILGNGRLKLFRFLTVFVIAGGLSAFWYNPKFLWLVFTSPQGLMFRKTVANLLPLSFFLLPLLATFGFLTFENRPQLQPLFLAVFFTIIFALLSWGGHQGLSLPTRYLAALGVSLAFLMGILIDQLWQGLARIPLLRSKIGFFWRDYASHLTVGVMIALLFFSFTSDIKGLIDEEVLSVRTGEVLGISDVERTGMWAVRERVDWRENLVGRTISLATIGGISWLKKRLTAMGERR